MPKKTDTNLIVGIIILIAVVLIFVNFSGTFSVTDLPSRGEYSSYISWSESNDLIIYFNPTENTPEPGFSNLHSIVDTLDTTDMIALENFFKNLDASDYTCEILGNVKSICLDRIRPANCQSYSQNFDIPGNTIKVILKNREIFACEVNKNELLSELPSTLIEPDGDVKTVNTIDYTGSVRFELLTPECEIGDEKCEGFELFLCDPYDLQWVFEGFEVGKCNVECNDLVPCSTGTCVDFMCQEGPIPPPIITILIIIGVVGGLGFLYFIRRKNGKRKRK